MSDWSLFWRVTKVQSVLALIVCAIVVLSWLVLRCLGSRFWDAFWRGFAKGFIKASEARKRRKR